MTDTKPKLGDHLQELMKRNAETGVEVADLLDVAVTTLRTWLNRNSLPPDVIKKLASRYGLPSEIDELEKKFKFRVARPSRHTTSPVTGQTGRTSKELESVVVDKSLINELPYIKRHCEIELERNLQRQPFRAIITGGRKTGKTCAVRWLQSQIAGKGPVVFFDLKKFSERKDSDNFLSWLANEAIEQVRLWDIQQNRKPRAFGSPLEKASDFAEWIRSNIQSHIPIREGPPYDPDNSTTLIFDGELYLDDPVLENLFIALHNLLNESAKYEELEYLNIILTTERYDALGSLKSTFASSSVIRTSSSIRAGNFITDSMDGNTKQDSLDSLFNKLHSNNTDFQDIKAHLWNQFRGHPWLTMRWLELLSGKDCSISEPGLFETIDELLAEEFWDKDKGLRPSDDNLESAIKTIAGKTNVVDFNTVGCAIAGLDGNISKYISEVQEIGLFSRSSDAQTLECSRWVAKQIMRLI